MATVTYSWSELALRKATYKVQILAKEEELMRLRLQLLVIEVLEDLGGKASGLNVMEEVIKRAKDTKHTALELCVQCNLNPEELIRLP